MRTRHSTSRHHWAIDRSSSNSNTYTFALRYHSLDANIYNYNSALQLPASLAALSRFYVYFSNDFLHLISASSYWIEDDGRRTFKNGIRANECRSLSSVSRIMLTVFPEETCSRGFKWMRFDRSSRLSWDGYGTYGATTWHLLNGNHFVVSSPSRTTSRPTFDGPMNSGVKTFAQTNNE